MSKKPAWAPTLEYLEETRIACCAMLFMGATGQPRRNLERMLRTIEEAVSRLSAGASA